MSEIKKLVQIVQNYPTITILSNNTLSQDMQHHPQHVYKILLQTQKLASKSSSLKDSKLQNI